MDLALLVSDFVDGGSGDSLDSSDCESGLSDLTDMISAAELLCCAWRCRPPASYACRRHRSCCVVRGGAGLLPVMHVGGTGYGQDRGAEARRWTRALGLRSSAQHPPLKIPTKSMRLTR